MIAHIPTMLLAIIMVGAVLSMSVGAVANRSLRDGMMYWTAGLAMHTSSYVFFSQGGLIGEFSAFIFANLFRSCAWAAFAEGLCEFYRRPPPRKLIWSPVAVVFLTFVFLVDNLTMRIITISVIFAAQALLALYLMWQMRRETPGRGKYFLMTGLTIAMTVLVFRALGATKGATAAMVSLTESSPIQTISFLGALIVLMLLAIGFVLMSKDRAEDMNRILSTRDELTGLANRRRMNEFLASEWARSKRSDQSLALTMIDIDQFKLYNDHYGHQAGDECLKRVAQAIQSSARRAGDLAARYGGEEFLLILPDTDAAAGQYLAEVVRKSVESLDLPHVHSPTGKVTISVGVAALTDGFYKDTESLLRAADEALYRAKHGGRNQVQVALESLRQCTLIGSAPVSWSNCSGADPTKAATRSSTRSTGHSLAMPTSSSARYLAGVKRPKWRNWWMSLLLILHSIFRTKKPSSQKQATLAWPTMPACTAPCSTKPSRWPSAFATEPFRSASCSSTWRTKWWLVTSSLWIVSSFLLLSPEVDA